MNWLRTLLLSRKPSPQDRRSARRHRRSPGQAVPSRPVLEVLEERVLLSGNWLPLDNTLPNDDGAREEAAAGERTTAEGEVRAGGDAIQSTAEQARPAL